MKLSEFSHAHTSAFDDLALPLCPSLYNLACWLTRNPSEAEDLVQETYAKALRGFGSFQTGTNFKAWIFRILRNCFLSSRSGLAATRTISLDESPGAVDTPDPDPSPEMQLILRCQREQVQAALEQLSPDFVEVLILCDVEEMKYRDIANVLSIPAGTVMSRISRARAALRQALLASQVQGQSR